MSATTTATATTGGTLAAATYFYRVSAIMARSSESIANSEVSQATTGSTSTVTLSFTPPVGLDGAAPILYKVYRSTATTTETLLGVVDATVGLAADNVTPILTTSIVDTGSAVGLVPMNSATAPAVLPTGYTGGNTGFTPRTGSDIYLIPRDPNFIRRPYVRDIQRLDVAATLSSPDSLPISLITDTALAVRAPKYIGRLRNVTTTLASTNPVQNTHSVS